MKSVRAYLLVLVTICMVLASGAFAVLLTQANEVNGRQIASQSQETAQALSQAVDGKVERALGVLSALKASEAAGRKDWRALDREARLALSEQDAWILVQDRSGQQLVNTRVVPGSALPSAPAPSAMWHALDAGKPHICDLVPGALEPRILCVDLALGGSRPPAHAISVIYRPRLFETIVARSRFEEGQLASLVDRRGFVIWRNLNSARFLGRRASGPLLAELAHHSQGTIRSTSLEGVPMLTSYYRSPLTGWTVVVGIPLNQIQVNSRQALLRGSVLVLAVLALSCILAALLSRRITRGLAMLEEAVNENGASSGRLTGLKEFDAAALALRERSAARARSDRQKAMLIGELNHRVKNTLAVVQSLAQQTFRSPKSPDEAIAAFEARLKALAGTHNLLTRELWESASLHEIVSEGLAPFCSPGVCNVSGPEVKIGPHVAVSFALAIHELATNALKYGALSSPAGRVNVSWRHADGAFEFQWLESGGPPVKTPERAGFGTRLVRRTLASELSGKVDIAFRPEGLCCRATGTLPLVPPPNVISKIEGPAESVA